MTGTAQSRDNFLRDVWYFAVPGPEVARGKMIHRTLLGEPLLIGRDKDGAVFALRDICPHRGIPLTYGQFDGREVECRYHGWRFGTDGRCTAIPSLVDGQKMNLERISTGVFPAQEVDGNIWIFFPGAGPGKTNNKAAQEREKSIPPIPRIPDVGDKQRLALGIPFSCNIDHAAVGLMDPAHGPFVHKSALWRTRKDVYEKEKAFSPVAFGWRMDRHPPSKNSKAYKLLGGTPTTEITFTLPSVRVEHIKVGRRTLCNLTACTPLDEYKTMVNHVMYWDHPLPSLIKPVVRKMARHFIGQDRDVVEQQQDGLKFDPKLMLINDADVLAKWYYGLKRELFRVQDKGGTFRNPVSKGVLRWRS